MMFYSRSNLPETKFATSSPDGLAPVYEERLDKNGVMQLVQTGKTDINALIQMSKESCDVYKILDRFKQGDPSVLDRVRGFFADVTEVPSSLMEAHQLVNKVARSFDSLPAEVKDAFGNDVNGMLASIEKGDFGSILAKLTDKGFPAAGDSDKPIVDNDLKEDK